MSLTDNRLDRWRERARRLWRHGGESAAGTLPVASRITLPRLASWRVVLAALPDPALLLSRQSLIVDFNDKAAELFPQLASGLPLSAVSRNPELLEGLGLIHDGGEQIAVELVERIPFERRLMATLSKLPIAGTDAEAPEILIIVRDLSEATRIEKTRKDFIANASHELRTPLASIIGFIETLQGAARNDTAAREKFLGVMSTQAQRMKRLVDDLMSLSRIEMHSHVMPRQEVDLNGILEDLRQSLAPLAGQEKARLSVSRLNRPAVVHGDRDELVQVFQNLIHNAIRHGRAGGNVTVQIEPAPALRLLRVHVIDDGPGIAPQHLPRLTERFYRVDVAASRKKEGTGLGLAIAKHVVNRHRGELEIKSELGKGSTFTVSLPEALIREN
jgi:two-component system, OmpR family, phosphate regulon sensor histidine kinase PhoR